MPASIIQYEEPIYCDPAFPVIFHRDGMDERRRFIYTNWHTGIELLFVTRGRGHIYAGMRHAAFEEGDTVIIESGALHTIYADSPACDYYCLIVEPAFLKGCGVPLDGPPLASVARDEESRRAFSEIIRNFALGDAAYKPAVLGGILLLFSHLCRRWARADAPSDPRAPRQQAAVQRALTYIREKLSGPIAIDEVCRHVGLSKYYFCRLFRAYTELSPIKYINMLRCDCARRLMAEGKLNVSEAARAVGVDNLSYFTRMYKTYMGALPSSALTAETRDKRGQVYGILGLQGDAPFAERAPKPQRY